MSDRESNLGKRRRDVMLAGLLALLGPVGGAMLLLHHMEPSRGLLWPGVGFVVVSLPAILGLIVLGMMADD